MRLVLQREMLSSYIVCCHLTQHFRLAFCTAITSKLIFHKNHKKNRYLLHYIHFLKVKCTESHFYGNSWIDNSYSLFKEMSTIIHGSLKNDPFSFLLLTSFFSIWNKNQCHMENFLSWLFYVTIKHHNSSLTPTKMIFL